MRSSHGTLPPTPSPTHISIEQPPSKQSSLIQQEKIHASHLVAAVRRSLSPTANTWSVYFADPELNGIEVFCDTPWHVPQPQGKAWDMAQDDTSLIESTRSAFAEVPGFGPGDTYVNARHAPRGLAP